MKVQRGIQAHEKRQVPGSSLCQAVPLVFVVVPLAAGKCGPDVCYPLLLHIKESGSWRSQHPFVQTAEVGIATNILDIHRDLSHALGPIEHRKNPSFFCFGADLLDRQNGARSGDQVGDSDDARSRSDSFEKEIDDLFGIAAGIGEGHRGDLDPISLFPG